MTGRIPGNTVEVLVDYLDKRRPNLVESRETYMGNKEKSRSCVISTGNDLRMTGQ